MVSIMSTASAFHHSEQPTSTSSASEDFKNVDDKLLTVQDLNDILKDVRKLRAYYRLIGLGLGIEVHDLDAIQYDHPRCCDEAWAQTLLIWLKLNYDYKKHGHPSWRRLVQAIKSTDCALAETIANKHSIGLIPPAKRQKMMTSPSTPTNNADYLEYLTQTLRDSYLKPLTNTWPPLRSIPFVELALVLIGTESLQLNLTTIKGNISDEILGRKVTVTLDSVLGDLENGSLILFEGRPGCGKTTLSIKIAHDWANKKIFEEKLVVLVHLRQLNGKEDVSLQDLLRAAYGGFSPNDIEFLSVYFENNSGENAILIFDGLDEYPPGRNFISRIIETKYLFKSILIVTSRPIATYQFRTNATKWIEVVGFQNKQITEFVKSCFKDNANKAKMLVKHFEEHQNLMNLCYLPLHCAMIIHFHRCAEHNPLPTTKSSFFKQFILSILYRSFYKRNLTTSTCNSIPRGLTSFEELPQPHQKLFFNVCKLAFHATIRSKQVFELSELNAIGLSLNLNHGDLDLLVIDCYFVMSGVGESYTFLHLTLQEYLAAVHISTFDDAQKKEIVRNHGGKKHLTVMWTFLCGMIDYTNPTMKNLFKEIIHASDSTTFHMQCTHESQQMSMCNYVFQLYANQFTFANVQPLDLTPFMYMLKSVDITNTLHLHLKECSFTSSDSTIKFLKEISDYCLSLEVSHGKAVKSVLDALGSPAVTMDKLIDLDIIGDHEVMESSTVTSLNKCTQLQTLKVTWINIGNSPGPVNSAFGCICWQTLKTLELGWCNLRPTLANILAERFQYLPNLTYLDICENLIGDKAMINLITNLLQYCRNLQELNLDANTLTDDSVPVLCELIKSADQLRELKLVIRTKIRSRKENRFSLSGWERLINSNNIERKSVIPLSITKKPIAYREERIGTDSTNSDITEHTIHTVNNTKYNVVS